MTAPELAAQRLAGTALAPGREIGAGGAVIVPGGTAHTFWNPRPEPARYVLVIGARTFALIQAIHATDDRSPEHMRQLFEAHGARLL